MVVARQPSNTGKAATELDTLGFLLGKARRSSIPIRHAFVHDPRTGGGPGPLSWFLRRPDALDLYLLLLAAAVRAPHNVQYPAAVWSRALGRGNSSNGELWVSKSLRWLDDHDLIRRRKVGREVEITIRHDSARSRRYTRPRGGRDRWEWFFNLSHAYFLEGWHKELSAAGKALLLVAHANKPGFELNQRRGEQWWGLSGDTLGRGLQELRDKKLLLVRTTTRTAPESRTGLVVVPNYTLLRPFSKPPARPETKRRRTPAARHSRGSDSRERRR